VDSNIFAFADNFGVRSTIAHACISFENNVFSGNLSDHLTDAGFLWADSSNWERSAVVDAEFGAFSGNSLELPTLPVDPAFSDVALTRLFTLPSRVSGDEWTALATAVGSSARPVPASEKPAAVVPEPAPAHEPSLSDLLAQLGKVDAKLQEAAAEDTAATGPVYCPAFNWSAARALFQDTPVGEPGAHKRDLASVGSAAGAQ
jgi:hypothetical protein